MGVVSVVIFGLGISMLSFFFGVFFGVFVGFLLISFFVVKIGIGFIVIILVGVVGL